MKNSRKEEHAMNKSKPLLTATGAIFILTVVIFLSGPTITGAAEKCDVVSIRGTDKIEPTTLTIKKGDCVVWINFTASSSGYPSQDVILSFKEGEKCVRTTKAPVGFRMDYPSGCYVAGWFSYGQTASLMFAEPGTYNYEVQFKAGAKIPGTIIVK
jgi:plastocyanin